MSDKLKFKVGDAVTWTSQSQAYTTTKVGVIAEVIPSERRPDATLWPQLFKGAGPGMSRNHESYIVTVGKKVYWPRANKLKPFVTQRSESATNPKES